MAHAQTGCMCFLSLGNNKKIGCILLCPGLFIFVYCCLQQMPSDSTVTCRTKRERQREREQNERTIIITTSFLNTLKSFCLLSLSLPPSSHTPLSFSPSPLSLLGRIIHFFMLWVCIPDLVIFFLAHKTILSCYWTTSTTITFDSLLFVCLYILFLGVILSYEFFVYFFTLFQSQPKKTSIPFNYLLDERHIASRDCAAWCLIDGLNSLLSLLTLC